MSIERLKQMEKAAREAADSDYNNTDERMDTEESFDFAYALQEAWPKLLAVIEAGDQMRNTFDILDDTTEVNHQALARMGKLFDAARAEL